MRHPERSHRAPSAQAARWSAAQGARHSIAAGRSTKAPYRAAAASIATRSARVSALDPVTCRVVRSAEFRAVLRAHPDVGLELLRMLSARLRSADRRIIEFGVYDTTRRVARLLADLAGHPGPIRGRSTVDLSQDDLAGLVGASRESVVRALTTLRSLELVTTARRRVEVLDMAALQSFGG